MPVIRVIQVDAQRLEMFVNTDNTVAITIVPDNGDPSAVAGIDLDADDLAELAKMCRSLIKEMGNG